MNKRLLTEDYKSIVKKTLEMPESNFYNYYLNIVEENFRYNPDIIDQINLIINNWILWYKSKVYGGKVRIKFEDGTTKHVDRNQVWESDEDGKRIPLDIEKTQYPLLIDFGIRRSVDRAFFDNQKNIVKTILGNIELKQRIIDFESQLPEPIKNILAKNPIQEGFDYNDIKNRVELLNHIPEMLTLYEKGVNAVGSQKEIPQIKSQSKSHMRNIALKYVYEGMSITRTNGNEIADLYGHTSGEKLFQLFTYYSSYANRKGKPNPCTPRKFNNKIELFERVHETLTDSAKKRSLDEIQILRTLFENEYQ